MNKIHPLAKTELAKALMRCWLSVESNNKLIEQLNTQAIVTQQIQDQLETEKRKLSDMIYGMI